jgi:hypothetical protein
VETLPGARIGGNRAAGAGLIKQLSAYVLDAALRQLRLWLDAGLDLSVP